MNEWSVNYAEQKVTVELLVEKVNQLEAQSTAVMFFGPKQPTQSDWEETYVMETNLPLPILPGVRLIWYHSETGAIKSYSTIWDVLQGKATSGRVFNYTDTSQPMGSFRLLGSMQESGSLVDGYKSALSSMIDNDRVLQLTRQYRMLWVLITSRSLSPASTVATRITDSSQSDVLLESPMPGVMANIVNTTGTSATTANPNVGRISLTDSIPSTDTDTGFVGMLCIESPDYPYINGVMEDSFNSPQITFYGANFINGYVATTIKRFMAFGHSANNNVLKLSLSAVDNSSLRTGFHKGYVYGWAANEIGAVEEYKDVVL